MTCRCQNCSSMKNTDTRDMTISASSLIALWGSQALTGSSRPRSRCHFNANERNPEGERYFAVGDTARKSERRQGQVLHVVVLIIISTLYVTPPTASSETLLQGARCQSERGSCAEFPLQQFSPDSTVESNSNFETLQASSKDNC